jgi:site-specific recombinase XerC
MTEVALTAADVARIMEELPRLERIKLVGRLANDNLKDKSYQELPLGQTAAEYLRAKRKRLTASSYRSYEGSLDKLARKFPYLEIKDFEPPVGTQYVEEFLDYHWGGAAARTYNTNLSIISDFFKWAVLREKLHGNPTLPIERAKARGVHRETFSPDQRRAILASQTDRRDQVALRLLLDYGLRKGALKAIRFQHFDHVRKRLTIFTKGGAVRAVPIPDPAFWHDLERLILDTEAQPTWFLLPGVRSNQRSTRLLHDKPRSDHGLHKWWYRCLANAGVVAEGTMRGERMHKARHSAGQRLLDHTGNLKAVQQLLGHASVATTGDIYTAWDEQQLAASLESAMEQERKRDE